MHIGRMHSINTNTAYTSHMCYLWSRNMLSFACSKLQKVCIFSVVHLPTIYTILSEIYTIYNYLKEIVHFDDIIKLFKLNSYSATKLLKPN